MGGHQVEVTVLDEADYMADLGFLPVVTGLLERTPAQGQRLLFSATLDRGVASLVERMARDRRVLFVLHEPTRQRLIRYGILERLKNVPGVEMRELQPYMAFVNLLAGADLIVTDGGSIQEESHYLNVPCLIMRAKTERMEGLGDNAYLAGFNEERIDRFFEMLPDLRRKNPDVQDVHPSGIIVDHVAAYA